MTDSPDDDMFAEVPGSLDGEAAEAAAQAHQVAELVPQIRAVAFPLLAGRPPAVQSAALADLTAVWLAGHIVAGYPAATTRLRADLFDDFVRLVGDLIRPNSMMIPRPRIKRAAREGRPKSRRFPMHAG